MFSLNEPFCISFPTVIKAELTKSGRRVISMEASNEIEDTEGDIILQNALMGSAESYLKTGHIDIDHYSELGRNPAFSFLGIRDPNEWIIGLPLEVNNLGGGRTGVKAEIFRNKDGAADPQKYKYDMFWQTLQTDPPARWYASIYGFPGPDTEEGTAKARRYLVKSFDWRSTAVTRTPVNNSMKAAARIVTAKAFAAHLPRLTMTVPRERLFTREEVVKSFYDHMCKACPSTDNGDNVSTWTIRDHYMKCECLTYNMADLYALATSELINRTKG